MKNKVRPLEEIEAEILRLRRDSKPITAALIVEYSTAKKLNRNENLRRVTSSSTEKK